MSLPWIEYQQMINLAGWQVVEHVEQQARGVAQGVEFW